MNGEGEASLTIALDNHLHFQESYTLRHDIPPMIQQHQRTLVTSTTIPEEDEEEEVEVEEEHNERERREDYDYVGKEEDNLVDIANRAFMLTCKKFSKQSYPEFRRRQAYSFLETWYLHSMYSKSQQILLGIAQAKPVVLLSGDDFMFTPQLVQQQHFDRMQQQQLDYWHDDDYDDMMDDDDYDDEEDEDVLIVQTNSRLPTTSTTTGTTSRMMIDENMWMGSSRHHQQDGQVDDNDTHVVHETIQDTSDNDREIQQELHEEQIEQVNEQEEETEYAALSPEVVHWYRSAQFHHRRPSTIMEVDEEEEEEEEEERSEEKQVIAETTISTIVPTVTITSTTTVTVAADEYQSLADIITSSPYQQQQETVITIPAITQDDNEESINTAYGTTVTRRIKATSDEQDNRMVIRNYFDTYHVSTRIVDTAWLVLETADTLTQDKQSVPIRQFTRYMFSIWRVFFLCVESILSDVGGLFTKSSKLTSFYPSTATNSTTTITTTNASLLV